MCRLPAVQPKIALKGSFLSRDEVRALLAVPDKATWCGRLNLIMLTLLYNTDARVSEMIGIRVADVTLAATSSVRLYGKGRKQRTVPLWKGTAAQIRDWLKYTDLRPDQPLAPTGRWQYPRHARCIAFWVRLLGLP